MRGDASDHKVADWAYTLSEIVQTKNNEPLPDDVVAKLTLMANGMRNLAVGLLDD